MKAGLAAIVWSGLGVTAVAIVLSPLFGFLLALLLVLIVSWVFVRSAPPTVDNIFRTLQLASAALYSLGHGGNDAQKTMGIIAVLLYSQGVLGETFYVPFWVIITCQAAMGLGTLLGGWRIVHTMGSKITRLHPVQGFCAEAGGAITLFLATYLGIPVSTTHTITGAIIGVGAARKVAAPLLVTVPRQAIMRVQSGRLRGRDFVTSDGEETWPSRAWGGCPSTRRWLSCPTG